MCCFLDENLGNDKCCDGQSASDKQDPNKPIGERQSPDGQEEPKTDQNNVIQPGRPTLLTLEWIN